MTDREVVLHSIRAALRDVPPGEAPGSWPVPQDYRRQGTRPEEGRLELFTERSRGYGVAVTPTVEAGIAQQAARLCARRGAQRLLVPADLPAAWFPPGLQRLDDRAQPYDALDAAGAVMTGCALAVAQTGTIVLDGGPRQGRRAISLLPDYHLCVVFAAQVVELLAEAIQRLRPSAARPLTLISGPSATSDIELNRVEGVHGPRTLDILLVLPERNT